MITNIPNILTLLRIILIPFIIYFHHSQKYYLSLTLLLISVVSDFFDGYLARKLNQETTFGAIFDPIADKLVALTMYTYLGVIELAPIWFVLILVVRNFAQLLSIPILVWWLKINFFVKPSLFAKIATAISDIYIFVPMFLFVWFDIPVGIKNLLMFIISVVELRILFTYIPRLILIATRKHDTFT